LDARMLEFFVSLLCIIMFEILDNYLDSYLDSFQQNYFQAYLAKFLDTLAKPCVRLV